MAEVNTEIESTHQSTMVEGGYVARFVDGIDEEFKCVICTEVLREPLQVVPCGHRFCQECLTNYIRSTNTDATCPMDRSPICKEKMFPDNGFKRKISNFNVFCNNKECGWKSTLSQLETHLANECMYVETSCPNTGCSYKMEKRFLEEHKNFICWQRLIQCDLCSNDYSALEIKKHKEDDCRFFLVNCLNDGCMLRIKRCELQSHMEGECLFTLQDCPLKFLGCQVKGIRSLIDEHLKQEARSHLRLVCDEFDSSRTRYEERLNDLQIENQKFQAIYIESEKKNKDKIEKLETENQKLLEMYTDSQILNEEKIRMLESRMEESVKENENKIKKLGIDMQKLIKTSAETNRDELEKVKKETLQQIQSTVAEIKKKLPMKVVSFVWNVRFGALRLQAWKESSIFKTGENGYHFQIFYCNIAESLDIHFYIVRLIGGNDGNLPETFHCDAELIISNPPTASAAAKPDDFQLYFEFRLGNEFDKRERILKISRRILRNDGIRDFKKVDIKIILNIPHDHPAVNQDSPQKDEIILY